MPDFPQWFDETEYSDFLAESMILFEFNVPLQKEKVENRKKMMDFDRQTAIRRGNLKMEIARDNARAKARGIQMGLGEQFKEKMMNDFLEKLEEERTPIKAEKRKMRPEVDPADRERDRKRESRRQDGQESDLKQIIIVKNTKRNKIEIIPKDDYNADTHTVLKGKVKKLDKGDVTPRDLRYYSGLDNFINTKTSVRLIGKVEGKEEEMPSESESEGRIEIPPPRMRVPKDGKEITDPASTYPDWDHTSDQLVASIPQGLAAMLGAEISPEYQDAISTSRTLGDSVQRFIKEILQEYPALAQMKLIPFDGPVKTGKIWSKFGMKDSMPNANFIGKLGKDKLGVGVKIGEQYRPTIKGEANFVFNSVLSSIPPEQLAGTFSLLVKDFMTELRSTFSALPTPETTSINQEGINTLKKQRWMKETATEQQQRLHNKAADLIEKYFNETEELKAAFLLESLSGNIKFDGKDGSVQLLLSGKKDGSDAKAIQLDQNFASILAKSSDTQLSFKFVRNPNASGGFLDNLFQLLTPTLTESQLSVIMELEKVKDQLANPSLFLQLFELQLNDVVFVNPITYSDFYQGDSDANNTIIINPGSAKEQEVMIPVKRNYTPEGDVQNSIEKGLDSILEEYQFINDYLIELVSCGSMDVEEAREYISEELSIFTEEKKKRNYKKEYDNYHSKPEQRANRSKRVLARRKMMEKGKVSKGDGKDVDHKNGNPQDNSDKNLRVLPKSKNRSMNEEHGAGFEGTDKLLQNLVDQTPLAVNPIKTKLAKYIEDRYVKKIKK